MRAASSAGFSHAGTYATPRSLGFTPLSAGPCQPEQYGHVLSEVHARVCTCSFRHRQTAFRKFSSLTLQAVQLQKVEPVPYASQSLLTAKVARRASSLMEGCMFRMSSVREGGSPGGRSPMPEAMLPRLSTCGSEPALLDSAMPTFRAVAASLGSELISRPPAAPNTSSSDDLRLTWPAAYRCPDPEGLDWRLPNERRSGWLPERRLQQMMPF